MTTGISANTDYQVSDQQKKKQAGCKHNYDRFRRKPGSEPMGKKGDCHDSSAIS